MGLVRSFIGTDGIWQYIPHINTGLFSIIKVHFLLFANLIVDWHINTINFTDSGNTARTADWGSATAASGTGKRAMPPRKT